MYCDWVWRLQYGARYYALVGIGWSSAGGYPGSDVYCGMFFVHMSEHPTSSVMSIGACDSIGGYLIGYRYAFFGGRPMGVEGVCGMFRGAWDQYSSFYICWIGA